MYLMPYANNKGADQLAHPRSLISAFVVRCLDSIIPILATSRISRLYLVPVAEQAGLSLTWSQIPEDTFSRGVAQLMGRSVALLAACVFTFCGFTIIVPFGAKGGV